MHNIKARRKTSKRGKTETLRCSQILILKSSATTNYIPKSVTTKLYRLPPHGSGRVQALLTLSMPLTLNTMDGEISAKLGSASHTTFKRDREPLILSSTFNTDPSSQHSDRLPQRRDYLGPTAFLPGIEVANRGKRSQTLDSFECLLPGKKRVDSGESHRGKQTGLLNHKNKICGSMRLCRERY